MLQQTLLSSHRQKSFLAVSATDPFTFQWPYFRRSITCPCLHKRAEEPHGYCGWESSGDDSLKREGEEQPAVLKSQQNIAAFLTSVCVCVCVCVCMHGVGSASLKWNTAPPRSVPASAVRRSHEGTNKGADSVVRGSPRYNTVRLLILIRLKSPITSKSPPLQHLLPADTFLLLSSSWPSPLLLWHWHI